MRLSPFIGEVLVAVGGIFSTFSEEIILAAVEVPH
jgi:hypothetical protein